MKQTLAEFEKQLWKNRQIENNLHPTICAGTPKGKWCRCKTYQQEMVDWDAWVQTHYVPPMLVAKESWRDVDAA